MSYVLFVEAHTPRGLFSGQMNQAPVTEPALLEKLVGQSQSHALNWLRLYEPSAHGGWREISLRQDILSQSVLVFEIRAVPGQSSTTSA